MEVPKFSKFLHGMALLYPHRLRNTPHWFVPRPASASVAAAAGAVAKGGAGRGHGMPVVAMGPASIEEMAEPSDPYATVSKVTHHGSNTQT